MFQYAFLKITVDQCFGEVLVLFHAGLLKMESGILSEWAETWGPDVTSKRRTFNGQRSTFQPCQDYKKIVQLELLCTGDYGLVDANYNFVAKDIDGRGEWADEYYIIYPDWNRNQKN